MGHKKLIRFAELETFENVLQFPKNIRGRWNEFFKNEKSLVLELACGKGEYAVGLGLLHHDKNFIGVDLKGNRIWVGAKKALENSLQNVAFLRTQIDQVNEYFSKDEVSEIWITFQTPRKVRPKAFNSSEISQAISTISQTWRLYTFKDRRSDLYAFTNGDRNVQLFLTYRS
jgi:tRNA (guanine-N7-)-methyltransferase